MKWELKLADGKRVEWEGDDGEDAARRYVDVHRDAAVVATRRADEHVHGVFVLGRHGRIVG
jgi:hypothetical protein